MRIKNLLKTELLIIESQKKEISKIKIEMKNENRTTPINDWDVNHDAMLVCGFIHVTGRNLSFFWFLEPYAWYRHEY